jgi:ammonium transporter Rh
MIVVGFGFLMTFLKRYGWSSVGFNFLFTGFTIQWSLLVTGFFHDILHHFTDEHASNATMHIQLNMDRMLEADFTTGAILISFGAVLGVASPVQLLFMILFEVVFYNVSHRQTCSKLNAHLKLNALVVVSYIGASDIGGSMVIHAFGAYFGLAVARVLFKPNGQMDNAAEGKFSSGIHDQ